jgi:glycosyltransferase involved in cell wall biosynthesis
VNVSVVIPTYRRPALIERAVQPLLKDDATSEVLVVDDGGDDPALAQLPCLRDARVRLLRIPNAGLAAARQYGLEHASGEVILFLDDDVIATPGMVTGHSTVAEREVRLGYMPVVPRAGATNHRYRLQYEAHCREWEANPDTILLHLWAGNMSMRRDDALSLRVHNPLFTARYHEDYEMGLRAYKRGFFGTFDRSLRADHLHVKTISASLREARVQGHAQRELASLHPDITGPYDGGTDFAGRLGWLVRATDSPPVYQLSRCLRPFASAHLVLSLLVRIEKHRAAQGQGSAASE